MNHHLSASSQPEQEKQLCYHCDDSNGHRHDPIWGCHHDQTDQCNKRDNRSDPRRLAGSHRCGHLARPLGKHAKPLRIKHRRGCGNQNWPHKPCQTEDGQRDSQPTGVQCAAAAQPSHDNDARRRDKACHETEPALIVRSVSNDSPPQGREIATCTHASHPSCRCGADPIMSTNVSFSVLPAVTSSRVPSATSWPFWITATRSQFRSTTSIMWLDSRIVPPPATY